MILLRSGFLKTSCQSIRLITVNSRFVTNGWKPGRDGLILEDGHARGTILPSVWESLPEPVDFLHHLKRKAGLSANHWSDNLRISRYHTDSFGEE